MNYESSKFLVSLGDMKEYLRITDTTDDGAIGMFLNMVRDLFDDYTGRKLKAEDCEEIQNGTDRDNIHVNNYPINTVVGSLQVFIDLDRNFGADSLVDTNDLSIDSENGIIYYDSWFPMGRQNVKIIYNGGFSSVPYDLQVATMETVAHLWKRREEKRWGVSSINQGGTNVQIGEQSIPQMAIDILNGYRRPNDYSRGQYDYLYYNSRR